MWWLGRWGTNVRVGENDASSTGVLDDETSLAFMSCNTTDRTREVIAMEGLDVLDFE
jgi:hypothetical protein